MAQRNGENNNTKIKFKLIHFVHSTYISGIYQHRLFSYYMEEGQNKHVTDEAWSKDYQEVLIQ